MFLLLTTHMSPLTTHSSHDSIPPLLVREGWESYLEIAWKKHFTSTPNFQHFFPLTTCCFYALIKIRVLKDLAYMYHSHIGSNTPSTKTHLLWNCHPSCVVSNLGFDYQYAFANNIHKIKSCYFQHILIKILIYIYG